MFSVKSLVISNICERLDGVELLPDGAGFKLDMRSINDDANAEKLKPLEDDLRRLFKLPNPSKIRAQKYVSSIMLHLARRMDYDIARAVVYYKDDPQAQKNKKTAVYSCRRA